LLVEERGFVLIYVGKARSLLQQFAAIAMLQHKMSEALASSTPDAPVGNMFLGGDPVIPVMRSLTTPAAELASASPRSNVNSIPACSWPKPATLINSVSVETPHGFRTFELHFGDILSSPTDLLVISAPESTCDRADGMLAEQLFKRFGFAVEAPQTRINFGGGVTAWMQPGVGGLLFEHLLTLCIADADPRHGPGDLYDRAVRAAYASIATHEFLGNTFQSISLPVIDRKRITNYEAAVRTLLNYTFIWLRRSTHTEIVRLFVYEEADLRAWDSAMNTTLGRSFVDASNEVVARSLCCEIVAKINQGVLAGPLAELETPLRAAMSAPAKLCVQTIATFGRKLAETVTEQLCLFHGLPLKRDLLMNIEAIRLAKVVADWIPSYLHTLRVFGNEGVHSLAGKRAVMPSQLSGDDLLTILCGVRALMTFWTNLPKTEPVRSS